MFGEKVREMARVCDGKAIDLIGSGYNEKVLPHGWLALIFGLINIELEGQEPEPIPQRLSTDSSLAGTEKVVEKVRRQLKDYWECLR